MSIAIDNALSKKMRADMNKVIKNSFTLLKELGYLRDDLDYSFQDDNIHAIQMLEFFLIYVIRRLKYVGYGIPQVDESMFIDEVIMSETGWHKHENKKLIREMVNKIKEEMLEQIILKI
jgi:hypothetical protein